MLSNYDTASEDSMEKLRADCHDDPISPLQSTRLSLSRRIKVVLRTAIVMMASMYLLVTLMQSVPHYPSMCSSSIPMNPEHRPSDLIVPPAEGAKIGTMTIYFGSGNRYDEKDDKNKYERSLATHESYAKRWGYAHWVVQKTLLIGPWQRKTTGMWTKEAMMLSILLEELRKPEQDRLEWIHFFDADTVIVNPNVPLDTFYPPRTTTGDQIIILWARDKWRGVNSGSFALRVCELSLKFLTTHLTFPVHHPRKFLKNGEQTVIWETSRLPQFSRHVAIVPQHWFNADGFEFFDYKIFPSYSKLGFQPGDFMMHFMGPIKTGWEDLLDYVENGKNYSLNVPLSNTRYMSGADNVSSWWQMWEGTDETLRTQAVMKFSDVPF